MFSCGQNDAKVTKKELATKKALELLAVVGTVLNMAVGGRGWSWEVTLMSLLNSTSCTNAVPTESSLEDSP